MRRLFILLLVALVLTTPVAASTFTVTHADDVNDGVCNTDHCSLREAINAANASAGTDTIGFNIAGVGPHTITPTTPLPWITQPVVIDGATQSGYDQPGALPMIALLGTSLVAPQIELEVGINIIAGGSTVRALMIRGFDYGAIGMLQGGGNLIVDNFIGSDATPTGIIPNDYGVIIVDSANNHVYANLIQGNTDDGVNIYGSTATGNRVEGNWITTNGDDGVKIEDAAGNTVDNNRIEFNTNNGVIVRGAAAQRNRITENAILENGLLGIALENGANANQAPPTLTDAWYDNSLTYQARGNLTGTPNSVYQVEFFASPLCSGQGETFLGVVYVTSNGAGAANFERSLQAYGDGTVLTVTDPAGNTSTFSNCVQTTTAVPLDYAPRTYLYDVATPTIAWSAADAGLYEVQIATFPEFNGNLVWHDDQITETVLTVPELGMGTYFWRVRGLSPLGPGPWSAVQSFTIGATPTP